MSRVCLCVCVFNGETLVPFFCLPGQYTLAVVVAFMNAGFRCFVVAFRKAGFGRGIYIKSFKNYEVSCTCQV